MQARIQSPQAVRFLRYAVLLLLAAGLACLALFFWYEFEATYFQSTLSHVFEEQRQRSTEVPVEPGRMSEVDPFNRMEPGSAPAPGAMSDVFGKLEIPRIDVEVIVLKGADPAALRRGAGWLPATSQLGAGNTAIAAHRDTYFRALRQIRQGDVIRVTTLDASYQFQVEWTAVVDPGDTAVLEPTSKPALTLITCYPFFYVGPAPQRFIVRASQQNALAGVAGELFNGNVRPSQCKF